MQRQFCIKLFSKISRNVSNPNTNSISSEPPFSSFLKTNTSPFSHQLHSQSFSRYSTLTGQHSLKSHTTDAVLLKIRYGFCFSNPILAKRFFSNTLLKGQSKCPVNVAKRNFHSFDSRRHGWYFTFYIHRFHAYLVIVLYQFCVFKIKVTCSSLLNAVVWASLKTKWYRGSFDFWNISGSFLWFTWNMDNSQDLKYDFICQGPLFPIL